MAQSKNITKSIAPRGVSSGWFRGTRSALLSCDTPQPSAGTVSRLHENDSFQPVVVRLGVMAPYAAGFEPGKTNEEIYEEVRVHMAASLNTTRDAYQFHITEFVCNTAPDSTRIKEDGTTEYYYPATNQKNCRRIP